jgi:hypothetical protein
VIIPDVVLIQLSSWEWTQSCSKHVEDSNKHIIEEIVRHVGYLPELYEDACSEKYIRKIAVPIHNMIRYDIYLQQLCSHPVAVVGEFVQK